jgi:hypothetical protein
LTGKTTTTSALQNLAFVDNTAVAARPAHYVTVTVDVAKILASWRESLFSYEWILPDGRLKSHDELSPAEQPKRATVEERVSRGEPLEKPVLGIGLMDNVEIGAGRAVFLTLAALGAKTLPVHIPKTHEDEFSAFLA